MTKQANNLMDDLLDEDFAEENLLDELPDIDFDFEDAAEEPADDKQEEKPNEKEEKDTAQSQEKEKSEEAGRAAEQEREELLRENKEMEGRVRQAEAAFERERVEKIDYAKAFAKTLDESVAAEIKSLESMLVKAKEDGETAKEVEITSKIAEKREERTKVRSIISDLDKPAPPPTKKEPEKNQQVSPPEAFMNWRKGNTWYDSPVTRADYEKRSLAVQIGGVVAESGRYSPESKAFYEEVDRRLKMAIESEDSKEARKESVVAPVNNSAGKAKSGSTKKTLSSEDHAIMKKLGLDVTDKKILETYYANKTATQKRYSE